MIKPARAWMLSFVLVIPLVLPLRAAPVGQGGIRFVGEPRLVATRPWAQVGRLAARDRGGFLLGFSDEDRLLVSQHDRDGERERLRQLGSLGYSGAHNLRSLASLGEDALVAAWNVDHHYAGFLYSRTEFIGVAAERVTSRRGDRLAPAVVGDGSGGAIGFFALATVPVRTVFGRWDPLGRLVRARRIEGTGVPVEALSFRGGVLLTSRSPEPDELQVEWFDAAGRRVESVRSRGLAFTTDGETVVAEYGPTSGNKRLVARFGSSPANLGEFEVLARAPAGTRFNRVAMAIGRPGTVLLAWSLWPEPADCSVWLQAFTAQAEPTSGPVCAVGAAVDLAAVTADAEGPYWLAWSAPEPDSLYGSQIWVRKVEID